MMSVCPNCGAPQLPDARYCEECGARLQAEPARVASAGSLQGAAGTHPPTVPTSAQSAEGDGLPTCARCGTQLESDSFFCHYCGAPVGDPATPSRRADCQATVPESVSLPELRVVVGPHQATVRFPPGKTELILGRNDPMGQVYPDFDLTPFNGVLLGVSRRHARIFHDRGRLYIEDNGSTNHTHVQNQQLEPFTPHPLSSGDEIRMGRLVLVVYVNAGL